MPFQNNAAIMLIVGTPFIIISSRRVLCSTTARTEGRGGTLGREAVRHEFEEELSTLGRLAHSLKLMLLIN